MKKTMTTRLRQVTGGPTFLLLPLSVVVIWAGLLLVGGCTSDPANLLGSGLVDNQIDTTLALVEISAVESFAGLTVVDAGQRIPELETLYLGTEKNTRASFIVNFDFGNIFTDNFPEELFTAENIKTVKINLTKFLPYKSTRDSSYLDPDTGEVVTISIPTGQPLDLVYFVNQLDTPFDPLDYETVPSVVPPFDSAIINQDFQVPDTSTEPVLKLFVSDFLQWVNAGVKIGLLFRLGDLSDPGLVGYASSELTTFSEVPALAVGTIPAPDIIVDFDSEEINLQIAPTEDTTIFEEIDTAPETFEAAADSFVLRTGLRSYPAIRFDLSALPVNALINRAVLSVVNDTSASYGPDFSVMISEIVAETMDNPPSPFDVATISDSTRVYPLSFRANLRTRQDVVIEFDITTGIRRAVNRVNEEPRGFLLSGVENKFIFPILNLPPDPTKPEFYYRQLNLAGFNDPVPEHRPRLRVWYSTVDELTGGGQ